MSLLLVPYNQAMRLGQGYNTYLQQICIDKAVLFEPSAVKTISSSTTDVQTIPTNSSQNIVQEVRGVIDEKPQIVTYKTAFVDKLSDVVENLNISAAAGIKTGTLSASGSAAYVNENKFKESNINFVVNVKVTNDKLVLDQENLVFNSIPAVVEDPARFTDHYGDGFISGFIEGGELNAIVNIKVFDQADVQHVKAQLQVASTAFHAEGKGEWDKETENKTSETNITINWSGGGQIKKPEEAWSIPKLLEAAAAYPYQVSTCPQKTWAIITKYKYLRDYVEKTQKCSFIEYELAATYTSTLLDNFIEYKLMLTQLAEVMTHIDQYQASSVNEAYAVDLDSLVRAKLDTQREMAKIVVRVTELTKDPAKALELANDPLPTTVTTIKDALAFLARLPVKKDLALQDNKITSEQTPRSAKDSTSYNTRDFRPIEDPTVQDSKLFAFSCPRWQPPRFAQGVFHLDFNSDHAYRISSSITDVTTTGYRVNMKHWADTIRYASGVNWLEMGAQDLDFQTGQVLSFLGRFPNSHLIESWVTFRQPFLDDVEVVLWLYHLDTDKAASGVRFLGEVQELNKEGFKLKYGTWGTNSDGALFGIGYNWIAYPKSKEGVESGWIHDQKGTDKDSNVQHEVTFTKKFKKAPRVLIAFSAMQVSGTDNLRVGVQVAAGTGVTPTGFKYEMYYWGKAILEVGSLYWIALEYD